MTIGKCAIAPNHTMTRAVHGEFKIQSIENNYVCGNAGRNGLSEQRARDPNVGHGAALDREIMRELSLVPRGPKGEGLPCYGPGGGKRRVLV
jgi:hypothetical protein